MRTPIRRLLTLTTVSACVIVLMASRADAASGGHAVRQAICEVFRSRCAMALRVASCESRLDPYAVSPTSDVGVFQVNYRAHHRAGESFAQFKRRYQDIRTNVRYAYRLSRGGTDWGTHWYMSRRCWA